MFTKDDCGPFATENALRFLSEIGLPATKENVDVAYFLLGASRLAAHDYASGKRMPISARVEAIRNARVCMTTTIQSLVKQVKS